MTQLFPRFQTILALVALVFLASSAPAQSGGVPDEAYLEAYMLKKDASRLQKEGKLQEAYEKFRRASHAYDVVARTWPSWEPSLINYRREQIRKEIVDLGEQLASIGTPPATAPPVGQPTLPPVPTNPSGSGLTPLTAPSAGGSLNDFARDLEQRQRAYEGKIVAFQQEALAARKAQEETQRRYQQTITDMARAKQEAKLFAEQKAAAEQALQNAETKSAEEVAAAKKELAELAAREEKSLKQLELAGTKSTEQMEKISQLEKILEDVTSERKELLKQRDEMEALLGSKGSTETEKKLIDENRRLRERLATALKDVAVLKKDGRTKDQKIASLEAEVVDLKKRVSLLQEENEAYQSRIEDLTTRLRDASGEMTSAAGVSDPALLEENRILKGVISRQIKKLAARKQRGRLVAEQLRQSDLKQKELIAQVEDLVDHRILLTEEEKALFRGTEVEAFAESGNLVTLMAPQEKDQFTAEVKEMAPPQLLATAAGNFSEGDYERTEVLYSRYLEVGEEAKAGPVLANLGVVQMRMQKFEDSEENLKQALRKMPDDAFPHFNLGFNYLWRDRAEDSVLNLESSARLNPENPKARFYLGVACARTEDYKRARTEFLEAVTLNPDYGDAHYNLAILHLLDGDSGLEKAREHYRKAIDSGIQPDPKLESKLAPTVGLE